MKLIADLIKEFPGARKYRAELEALAAENERLKAENAELRRDPSHFLEKWETLDGPAVATLIELAQLEHGNPADLAASGRVHIQLAESYLKYLATREFVYPHPSGKERYRIGAKGQRYLHERGILKTEPPLAQPAAKARAKAPAKKPSSRKAAAPARKAARRKRG